jgi:hypothetical protein
MDQQQNLSSSPRNAARDGNQLVSLQLDFFVIGFEYY